MKRGVRLTSSEELAADAGLNLTVHVADLGFAARVALSMSNGRAYHHGDHEKQHRYD